MIYFDTIMAIERLHALFFNVIKFELDRQKLKDLNPMQSFILYNIAEHHLSVGEISNRGYYMGSNITYNLKKLIENKYVIQEPSVHDRRSSHVKLSDKGMKLYKRFQEIFNSHSDNFKHNNITESELKSMNEVLLKLESFWKFVSTHQIAF